MFPSVKVSYPKEKDSSNCKYFNYSLSWAVRPQRCPCRPPFCWTPASTAFHNSHRDWRCNVWSRTNGRECRTSTWRLMRSNCPTFEAGRCSAKIRSRCWRSTSRRRTDASTSLSWSNMKNYWGLLSTLFGIFDLMSQNSSNQRTP